MKIYIRPVIKTGEKELKKTTNHIYVPLRPVSIQLFPIPTFVKTPKCETCQNPAHYLLKQASPICPDCVNKLLENSNRIKKHEFD